MHALLILAAITAPYGDLSAAADLDGFPPREVAEGQVAANEAYQAHLFARRRGAPPGEVPALNAALVEAQRIHEVWGYLLLAHREVTPRRRCQYLAELRRLLGSAAYYAGEMPPGLPLHLLERRR